MNFFIPFSLYKQLIIYSGLNFIKQIKQCQKQH